MDELFDLPAGAVCMPRVLQVLKESGLDCLSCEAFNLDYDRFQHYRDRDEHPAEKPFEDPLLEQGRRRLDETPPDVPTILRYFLDGSRRTYHVGDVIVGRRKYYPLVGGQVGVAVVERLADGHVTPLREFCEIRSVLAIPDQIPDADRGLFEERVNSRCRGTFRLLNYTVDPAKDAVDLAVARIMSEMHDAEIRVVKQMAAGNLLSGSQMLVIDGPLRFRKRFDIVQFRNVIGVSKSFRPTVTVGRGRKRVGVGTITSDLDFGERTNVFRVIGYDKVIGAWYLRLRDPARMSNPLQGVVKVEQYAIDPKEKENGLDGVRVDNVSRFLLRERNVTPYKIDRRWASHIYPIYLAETFLKTSFRSDMYFKALF